MCGQEGWYVFAQVGLDGQGDNVGRIDLIRLGIHPEIQYSVTLGALWVSDIEG